MAAPGLVTRDLTFDQTYVIKAKMTNQLNLSNLSLPVIKTVHVPVSWLSQIEAQTIALRDHLKSSNKANVYSLNPFINLSLEGHAYTRQNL